VISSRPVMPVERLQRTVVRYASASSIEHRGEHEHA
jgi:hypothetical protein